MTRPLAILTVLLCSSGMWASEPVAPAPGATVPDFSLRDIHRRPRSLAGYKDSKAFVVIFLDTECRLANLYVPTLLRLHRQYADKGVRFLAINSNAQDSFAQVSAHAQERDIPFPVLKDFDHAAADAFGAKRSPEAFLLDAERVIRYHGRIDDQYGLDYRREKPTRDDLAIAIDELLAGKKVATPSAEVSGCLIERARKPQVASQVNYAKHVAPILQKRCQECHRPGEVGPFALLSYEDARKRTRRIREVVLEERMPPWHADPRHSKFLNDRRLTSEERDTLLAWIEQGAVKGDDKDLPAPLQFVEGWRIGKPEQVFTMAEPFEVPATGVLPYKRFVVDPGFDKDMWVQAAEARPGNRKVVHHIVIYFRAPGKELYGLDGTTTTLVGWAPGDMPALYTPGTAKRIPAKSKLVFEVHYTPDGTKQTDRSSVGLIFAKEPPRHEVDTNILANMTFKIPPGTANHKGQFTYVFRDDATLLSFMPHMHLRGVSARYEVAYPDGKKETLLSVPDYDFNWQSVYRFEKPLSIPRGTKLTWTAHWDNSADNPRNPDAKKEVRWGLQTWDEMQNGWMEVIWKNPKAKK